MDLSGLNEAEGAVNAATVTDPIAGVSLPGLTFGEAAVNLTAAGVFPPGSCTAFGSAMVKSRSSASFTAEVKDFIAPQPVNTSNCGTIAIHKVTENGDSTFGYTTSGGLSPATFTLSNGGTRSYAGVAPGSYGVTESPLPSGWTLESLNCTSTGSGTSVSAGAPTASITMAPGGTVDCTYTNHTNASPTIGTTLSATTVSIGTPVHDSSTLSGATAGAGGTVTYTVYANSGCTQGAQGAGTSTVTSGVVPDSDPITFGSAGTYYWQAVYSGDADNNPATSPCIEEQLTVSPNSPGISTAQNLLPNDSATIAGATSTAGGTITFSLYGPSDATCAGTPALTQSVGVAGDGTYSTSNTTFTASQVGTWRWKVVYGGDANNLGTTSACGVENFTITD